MLKVDLHMHTCEDKYDRVKYTPQELIDRASSLKFDVLAITHHHQYFYPPSLVQYAKKKGILLISGVELRLEKCDILAYNLTEQEIHTIRTINQLRSIKKKKDILIIAPHPFYPAGASLRSKLLPNIDLFDAIEFCHLYNNLINFNKKAVNVSLKYKLSLIGNSDAHMWRQFHTTYSLIDAKKNMHSIFSAIRKGKVQVVTQPLSLKDFIMVGFWAASAIFLPEKLNKDLLKTSSLIHLCL